MPDSTLNDQDINFQGSDFMPQPDELQDTVQTESKDATPRKYEYREKKSVAQVYTLQLEI